MTTTLPELPSGKLGLLIAPGGARETMMELTAVLAQQGPVCVIDGGNQFAAYQVARHLRRQTPQLEAALGRITLARAFTCYQVVALLTQTPATAVPLLALDLLATFTDESVPVTESFRLWRLVCHHLRRLRHDAPVIVSLRPPPQPERSGLVSLLQEVADVIQMAEASPVARNLTLF
ncbi:MAG TPA: hypothetical protein PLD25_32700 [Chloroflexota bacterium]|nr:hypothetical protein [Chloroflexota bacterium]HUM68679.1 hypothetical protein [Chloroflexota bacterium]